MVKVENIKVAVRVRPFNSREKAKGCRRTVSMVDKATFISDPTDIASPARQFSFDHSYWSHDGFRHTDEGVYIPESKSKYIDQRRVFADLGSGLLDNAWSGYNCTLFAYGQTGSGKTYSMMGYGPNKGLIPTFSETLFQDITTKGRKDGVIYKVSFSMCEIYNEMVFDLLNRGNQPLHGLPVRMNQKKGFYVEGLLDFPVSSFEDVEYYIEECNKNRTMAVTHKNETSSRAHTIVTISFVQNFLRENRTKSSKINMVDLAGSERASQTGATGVRFEESKNINKSLMTLGQVIKSLCAMATGRDDQGPTPYRDSKLTMLLKDAIGGNCKTVMVATLSPSDEDFEQTLSTLRYADRVKSIKNQAKMNVSPTDKLIKELLAEKNALLDKLKEAHGPQTQYTRDEMKKMKEKQLSEIEQIKSEMADLEKAWKKRLKETKARMQAEMAREQEEEKARLESAHLYNLNEDPVLSGKVYHLIKQGPSTTVGNARALNPPDIVLHGPSIAKEHGVFQNRCSKISISPLKGQIRVNGELITERTTLGHLDRLLFGASNLFVLHHPAEEKRLRRLGKSGPQVTYDMAQTEIRKHTEEIGDNGQEWLRDDLSEMLALTNEANAMAVELKKGARFDPVIVPTAVLGKTTTKCSQVFIRVSTCEGGEFLWSRDHFLDRFDLMMSMFQKYEIGDMEWNPRLKTQDPFWEPLETPTLIGVAYLPLESIAYMLDIDEQKVGLYDYQARQVGFLIVSLVPCDVTGTENPDGLVVDEPIDLVGKDIQFKIKIQSAMGIPKRYKSSWCHYVFYDENTRRYTDELTGAVPRYNYEHLHEMKRLDHKALEFLEHSSLMLELHGRQIVSKEARRNSVLDAYTIRDHRRGSTVMSDDPRASLYPPSTGSSCCPISTASSARLSANSVILETDETEDGETETESDEDDSNASPSNHFSDDESEEAYATNGVDYNRDDQTNDNSASNDDNASGDDAVDDDKASNDNAVDDDDSDDDDDGKTAVVPRTVVDLPDILRESSAAQNEVCKRNEDNNTASCSTSHETNNAPSTSGVHFLEEMRLGISSIMEEVIRREGLSRVSSGRTRSARALRTPDTGSQKTSEEGTAYDRQQHRELTRHRSTIERLHTLLQNRDDELAEEIKQIINE